MKQRLVLILAAVLVSASLAACAPSYKGIRAEEVQQIGIKYTFKHNKEDVYNAFLAGAARLGYIVDSGDPDALILTGVTPWSLFSYGERFAVAVEQPDFGPSVAYVSTELLMKTNILADASSIRRDLVRVVTEILQQ